MTIYVLDSHPLMSQAISFLLRRIDPAKKIVEVHVYSKLQEAMLINGQPEAFVMEPLITGISGTTDIKKIKFNYPSTPLILYSSIPSKEAQDTCLAAGADLYIEKSTPLKNTFKMFSAYMGGTTELDTKVKHEPHAEGFVKFSKRQKQLLVLVDAGLRDRKSVV